MFAGFTRVPSYNDHAFIDKFQRDPIFIHDAGLLLVILCIIIICGAK